MIIKLNKAIDFYKGLNLYIIDLLFKKILIYQMEEKSFLHTLMKTICGKKFILQITDTAEIMAKQ